MERRTYGYRSGMGRYEYLLAEQSKPAESVEVTEAKQTCYLVWRERDKNAPFRWGVDKLSDCSDDASGKRVGVFQTREAAVKFVKNKGGKVVRDRGDEWNKPLSDSVTEDLGNSSMGGVNFYKQRTEPYQGLPDETIIGCYRGDKKIAEIWQEREDPKNHKKVTGYTVYPPTKGPSLKSFGTGEFDKPRYPSLNAAWAAARKFVVGLKTEEVGTDGVEGGVLVEGPDTVIPYSMIIKGLRDASSPFTIVFVDYKGQVLYKYPKEINSIQALPAHMDGIFKDMKDSGTLLRKGGASLKLWHRVNILDKDGETVNSIGSYEVPKKRMKTEEVGTDGVEWIEESIGPLPRSYPSNGIPVNSRLFNLVEAANRIGGGDRYDDLNRANLRVSEVARKLHSIVVQKLASSGGPKIEVKAADLDYDASIEAEFGTPAPNDRSFGDEMTLSIQIGVGYWGVNLFDGRRIVSHHLAEKSNVAKASDYLQAVDPFVKKYLELNSKLGKGKRRK